MDIGTIKYKANRIAAALRERIVRRKITRFNCGMLGHYEFKVFLALQAQQDIQVPRVTLVALALLGLQVRTTRETRSPGPTGLKGSKGDAGLQGQKGTKGEPGLPGLTGKKGEKGSSGLAHPKGVPRQAGQKGDPGVKGDSGQQGTKGGKGQKGEGQLSVRIHGGQSQGQVEVYYNGIWGTIFNDSWDNSDATVFCLMLGYSSGKALFNMGASTGEIWLDVVACEGPETSIWFRNKSTWGSHNCQHTEDAAPHCPAPGVSG
ncbi:LOW QUALITY PROTEIN: macrophage receptor MARCO [Rhynchocyon petersi]